jgi:hypothetical protein
VATTRRIWLVGGAIFLTMALGMLTLVAITIHNSLGMKFASDTQFSWQVKLALPREDCGGVIVANGWAMTATHCLVDAHVQVAREIKVIAGKRDVSGLSGDDATGFAVAPDYVPPGGLIPGQNDIALIKFDMPAQGASVIPITTDLQTLPDTMFVSGWSCADQANVFVRAVLQIVSDCGNRLGYTDVEPLDASTCQDHYGDRFVCAGGSATSNKILPGFDKSDSGGGLTTSKERSPQLVGIANYIGDQWETYARAALYVPWLKACICKNAQTANEPLCRLPDQEPQPTCAIRN